MMDKHPNSTRDVVELISSTYGSSIKVLDNEIPMSVLAIKCDTEVRS